MNITEYDVDNNVKNNPPRMTHPIFIISIVLPHESANGKVIKDGTKNIGNHFANIVAPGYNSVYIIFAIGCGTSNKDNNNVIQAPKLLGNAICNSRNKRR